MRSLTSICSLALSDATAFDLSSNKVWGKVWVTFAVFAQFLRQHTMSVLLNF